MNDQVPLPNGNIVPLRPKRITSGPTLLYRRLRLTTTKKTEDVALTIPKGTILSIHYCDGKQPYLRVKIGH